MFSSRVFGTCLLSNIRGSIFIPHKHRTTFRSISNCYSYQDGAYATEVHHIDGNGKDQGVVYSEMQAKEFDMEDIAHVELSRTIYPPTNGYHYVSGGVLKNLRDSTSNAKVRQYDCVFITRNKTNKYANIKILTG